MTVVVQDLIELAGRCEKATGPDREADLAINLALWPDGDLAKMTQNRRGLDSQEGYAWTISGGSVVYERWTADGRCPHNGGYPLPHYTGSIDAAMTLVPEGFLWKCGYSRHVPHQADLTDYKNHTGRYDGNSDHSRALALCAAALRARASIKGEG